MSRKLVKLKCLAADGRYSLIGGPFGSKLTSADYVEDGIPVIRGSNLNGGRYLAETEFVYVSEQKMREDLFGNLAHRGDVVFTQRGTLGQTALIPDDARYDVYVISQSKMKLTADPEKADPRFVYYYFSSREAVQKILNQNSSSGVPHINLDSLRNFLVPQVLLHEQRNIADTLSVYDDLIENNNQRISLLEEAARLLYREWFAHFRFPGHEHVKATDGIPDGWKTLPASEAFAVNPTTPRNDDGTITYVPMAALSEGGMSVGRRMLEKRQRSTSVRFRNGDTLFARITPSLENGKTGFVQLLSPGEVACGSTEFIVLRGRHVSNHFVYLTARQPDFRENAIRSMIGSSGRQRVQPSCFDRYGVPVPSSTVANLFDEATEPMFEQINRLDQQNQKLAEARDLLLPRLMSGELAV